VGIHGRDGHRHWPRLLEKALPSHVTSTSANRRQLCRERWRPHGTAASSRWCDYSTLLQRAFEPADSRNVGIQKLAGHPSGSIAPASLAPMPHPPGSRYDISYRARRPQLSRGWPAQDRRTAAPCCVTRDLQPHGPCAPRMPAGKARACPWPKKAGSRLEIGRGEQLAPMANDLLIVHGALVVSGQARWTAPETACGRGRQAASAPPCIKTDPARCNGASARCGRMEEGALPGRFSVSPVVESLTTRVCACLAESHSRHLVDHRQPMNRRANRPCGAHPARMAEAHRQRFACPQAPAVWRWSPS